MRAMSASPKQHALLEQIQGLIQQKNYYAAIDLINRSGQNSAPTVNARGVCLLRMGMVDKAVDVFRELVFPAGSICADPDVPLVYRTNFVTAMFLAGNLDAGLSMLRQIKDRQHPAVIRLCAAVKAWKQGLGLFQRLGCLLNAYPRKPVRLDFVRGDLL